jgi:hypothetical protein
MQPTSTVAPRPGAIDSICTLDRMAEVRRTIQAPAMIRPARPRGAPPSPDNALYDHACDLLQAAAAIRHGATDALATPAIPSVLGCIEAALHELSGACDAIQQSNGRVPGREAAATRMARGLVNLRVALDDAQAASQAARALAARRFAGAERVADTR